ncbi:hypothetical protein ACFOOK_00105 [Micromonospora krabiensis]|uniref:Right handed beta helix region n=1 Tax=Micromonospora krabiensis TaxID=307121 RepID=A0A1C3MY23_9ACTN|nr:right-handed parallel beta-helix repeat-containing protein [Micromonospora krabiensis]SBV25218.1 Right handed beta helix region [Micromonospora krabiensis]
MKRGNRHDARTAPVQTPTDGTSERSGISRRALSTLGMAGVVLAGGQLLAPTAAQAEPADPVAGGRRRPRPLGEPVTSVDELRDTPGTAPGQWVTLTGYHADKPGLGGGELYWDAASTAPDNGGTVFAVTGVATGRWKRPATNRLSLAWFGCTGVGDTDDSVRVQAAVNALPIGGVVEVGPGRIRLEHTVRVENVPVLFQGAGVTDNVDYATQLVVATGAANGLQFVAVRGGGLRDLQVRGEGLTGGYLVATERTEAQNNYLLSFTNVRFRDGWNGMLLRGCNSIRFLNCVWNGFRGEQVILLNGAGDTGRADPVEFVQCGIAAGTGNNDTDNLVIDGLGGSIKFIATAVLFGRHGIWLRNRTGQAAPKFLYFEGGGFENGHGVPVLLEAGAQAQFTNTYISGDNEHDAVRIGSGFTGSATITNSVIRGCGRNGIDIGSTRVTVTGCLIGNNGRTAHPSFSRPIADVTANGSGGVRITTGAPHGWETGDRITVSDVTGTTEANGKWRVTVVDDTTFDLVGVGFSRAYAGGGTAWRNGAGVNIRSTASRVVLTGNAIGSLADGISRQDYGVVCDASDVLVTGNDLAGNTVGAYQITGNETAQTRFFGNKGVAQYDGWLTARVDGPVTDGLVDFGNALYLDGQRIRIVRVTRRLTAGTCSVRLDADGTPVGGGALGADTALQSTTLAAPYALDGVGGPKRLRLRVSNTAGATGLEVQFAYQLVS